MSPTNGAPPDLTTLQWIQALDALVANEVPHS